MSKQFVTGISVILLVIIGLFYLDRATQVAPATTMIAKEPVTQAQPVASRNRSLIDEKNKTSQAPDLLIVTDQTSESEPLPEFENLVEWGDCDRVSLAPDSDYRFQVESRFRNPIQFEGLNLSDDEVLEEMKYFSSFQEGPLRDAIERGSVAATIVRAERLLDLETYSPERFEEARYLLHDAAVKGSEYALTSLATSFHDEHSILLDPNEGELPQPELARKQLLKFAALIRLAGRVSPESIDRDFDIEAAFLITKDEASQIQRLEKTETSRLNLERTMLGLREFSVKPVPGEELPRPKPIYLPESVCDFIDISDSTDDLSYSHY